MALQGLGCCSSWHYQRSPLESIKMLPFHGNAGELRTALYQCPCSVRVKDGAALAQLQAGTALLDCSLCSCCNTVQGLTWPVGTDFILQQGDGSSQGQVCSLQLLSFFLCYFTFLAPVASLPRGHKELFAPSLRP